MIRKVNLIEIVSPLMFLLCIMGYGQTSNEGMLYISSDTKFSTEADLKNKPSGTLYNQGEAYIYRNFENNGIVDFYQNTGTTFFVGNSPQLISGDNNSLFYNINFDNYSIDTPFHLSGHIEIFGTSNFIDGIIDIDNYGGSFLYASEAKHINTSNASHVDGVVEKRGNSDFIFPIGDGGYYRHAGISSPELVETVYSSKYFYEDPGHLYDRNSHEEHIELIDENEFWEILPYNDSQDDVLITLSWNESTTPEAIMTETINQSIHIVRWNEDSNQWIDEGGVVNTNEKTITTAVGEYGIFTLAKVSTESNESCELVVHNAITPNGDGINDYFSINIDNAPCNIVSTHVQIYNRWGVKVFESDNYGFNGDIFDGYSNGRLTVSEGSRLPTGTYFYILKYGYNNQGKIGMNKQTGYLYLNGN